jgi:heme-degrading monooxygenase HmoA
MIVTLFGDVVVRKGKEEGEARLSESLRPILEKMPGFISYKNYRADDGEEVGIIRFDTRASLEAWAHEGVHGAAQRVAPEFYESFWVQTAETYREYTWDNGTRSDGDLTELFAER